MSRSTSRNTTWIGVSTPQSLMRAVLAALSQGRISEAVDNFADHFTFNDRALGLEFVDRERLTDFFNRSRELFPDTALEDVSTYESGDTAFAEWKLTATQPTNYCGVNLKLPISLRAASIARIESGRIRYWSDYYDEKSSMRLTLAASYIDWIAY